MNRELELRLRFEAGSLDRILRHASLGGGERRPTRTLSAHYFDTPDLRLAQNGVGVRIREDGGRWLQTVKLRGDRDGGVDTRLEYETEVDGPGVESLDLSSIPEVSHALGAIGATAATLQRVLFTAILRDDVRLERDESEILVSIDRGELRSPRAATTTNEIELELVRGDVAELFALALELAGEIPLALEPANKLERGLGIAPRPETTIGSALTQTTPARDAFDLLASSCASALLAQRAAARAGKLRTIAGTLDSLRAGLRLVRKAAPKTAHAALNRELRRLQKFATSFCGWDEIAAWLDATEDRDRNEDSDSLRALRTIAHRKRAAAERRLRIELSKPRLDRALLLAGTAIGVRERATAKAAKKQKRAGDRPLGPIAAIELDRLDRRVRSAGEDPDRREKVARRCARLGATLDAVAPLYDAKVVDDLRAATQRLERAASRFESSLLFDAIPSPSLRRAATAFSPASKADEFTAAWSAFREARRPWAETRDGDDR